MNLFIYYLIYYLIYYYFIYYLKDSIRPRQLAWR